MKTAVITGASSGIGLEIAKNLYNKGYNVVCVSRTEPDIDFFDFYKCDLSISKEVEETAKKIIQKYPHIDILVNNAGLGISGATELLPEDKIRYVAEVDYFAPLIFSRALLPAMGEKSKIIMMSSACALFALPYRGVYCSAKAALNMLAFSLRMELKKSKIAVICVCPGDIKSEFTQNRLKFTDTNSRYGESVINSQNKIDTRQNKRMDVKKASAKITKIIIKKKGALYIIGTKYKFLYFCSKIFSQNFMLKMTNRMFNK